MSFLKNIFNPFTDKRELEEPKLYKEFNENSPIITNLTRLAESNDPNIDKKKVESHLKLFSIGHAGEKNVLFELQHSMLPLVILHDVYLEYGDYHAQLDFVIITHKFVLILEVKKLFGNITVTDNGEFQRVITKNNRVINKEGMYSPINQVERHVAILEKLLKDNGVKGNCPVKYAVTFANPKTILDISQKAPENIRTNVIRHDQIKTYVKNALEKKSPVSLADQQLYEIADTIQKYSKEKVFHTEDYMVDAAQAPSEEIASETPVENQENSDSALKAALTEFRLKRSKELKIKPYHIFTNKILDSLLEKRPQTIEHLLEIDGVGRKIGEEYGKDILAIIKGSHTIDSLPSKGPAESAPPNPTERPAKTEPIVQPGTDSIDDLRSALTAFRTQRSKQLNVKPYYIFTNNTLESILDKKPATINDLLQIEGIGPKKAEEFGQDVLDILQDSRKVY